MELQCQIRCFCCLTRTWYVLLHHWHFQKPMSYSRHWWLLEYDERSTGNLKQGVVHKLRWQFFFFFFDLPLGWHFLWYNHWQKVDFLDHLPKVCTLKNNTNLNPIFCLVKSSKIDFIFSPALHLIIWVLILTKKFEKIAILKIWQMVFFRGVKTYFGVL